MNGSIHGREAEGFKWDRSHLLPVGLGLGVVGLQEQGGVLLRSPCSALWTECARFGGEGCRTWKGNQPEVGGRGRHHLPQSRPGAGQSHRPAHAQ